MSTPERRQHIEHLVEKLFARLLPFDQFGEQFSVFDKQNPPAVAGRKRIVSDHENRRPILFAQILQAFQQIGRRFGIQCTGWLIRKN